MSTGFGATNEELAAQVLSSHPADAGSSAEGTDTTSAVQLGLDLLVFYSLLAWFSLVQQVRHARCAAAAWLASPLPKSGTQQLRGVVRIDAEARALLQWVASSGIALAGGARLGSFDGHHHGVIATSDIPRGTVLVSVPSALALSVSEVAMTDEIAARGELCTEEDWCVLPWYARLALLLLRERERGEASPLQPWIAALPEPPDVPMLWGEEELAELQARRGEG